MNSTIAIAVIELLKDIPHMYRFRKVMPYLMNAPLHTRIQFPRTTDEDLDDGPYWWVETGDRWDTRPGLIRQFPKTFIKDLYNNLYDLEALLNED